MTSSKNATRPVRWASNDAAANWTTAHICGAAMEFHNSMPGYRPTPLTELPALAAELDVGAVLVKDESDRLGLPAFKILGASWGINCALSRYSGFDAPARNLTELRERTAPVTLVTATDGNHGRALARVAALLGVGSAHLRSRGNVSADCASNRQRRCAGRAHRSDLRRGCVGRRQFNRRQSS